MAKTAFLFAGQGTQYAGMGRELYEASPAARAVFDMGEAVRPGTLKMCFEGPGDELTKTVNTQPCLFLTDLACARALEEKGVRADALAGFSLGEIPALAFSGMLTDEEAFKLVTARGKAMDECASAHPGSMVAALKLPNEKVEEVAAGFENVYPVNYNCPGQLSCAGALEELDAFADAIKAAGGRAVKLAVSGAFHTLFMADAAEVLKNELSKMIIKTSAIPLYSNRTGEVYPEDEAAVKEAVSVQLMNPVRWEDTVRNMYEAGVRTFIECGAGTTLGGLVKKMKLEDITVLNVADVASLSATLTALGL